MWSIPGKLTLSTNTMKKLCFLLSLAAIVLVSLATKAPDKSITDEFELAAAYNKPIHK